MCELFFKADHKAYDCSVSGLNRGTLYVSQNFICFSSKLNSRNIRIPFNKLVSVNFEPGALGDKVNVKDDQKLVRTISFGVSNHTSSYFPVSE